jgi:NAD(P)-dependent dehydrogenase (short-subunit alcohol dehydrogenase family)
MSINTIRFDGRVCLVTGAGAGIGRAHALLFGSRGAKVVVNDMNPTAAQATCDEIIQQGGIAVTNTNSVVDGALVVATAIDTWGRIDIIVNNAGILRDVSFGKMTEEQWDIVYDVHAKGTKNICKAAWPIMRKQKYGRIVNTTSVNGLFGQAGQANYSFVKAGIIGFSYTLAQEGSRKNIHVNCLAPQAGTAMTKTVAPDSWTSAMKAEYVSPVVAYLCSEESKDNGIVVEAGGGWFAQVRWQQSSGYSHANLVNSPFTPEVVRDGWDKGKDYETNPPSYPNWDYNDGKKHSSAGHTMNLLSQGLMVMPSPPTKKKSKL